MLAQGAAELRALLVLQEAACTRGTVRIGGAWPVGGRLAGTAVADLALLSAVGIGLATVVVAGRHALAVIIALLTKGAITIARAALLDFFARVLHATETLITVGAAGTFWGSCVSRPASASAATTTAATSRRSTSSENNQTTDDEQFLHGAILCEKIEEPRRSEALRGGGSLP